MYIYIYTHIYRRKYDQMSSFPRGITNPKLPFSWYSCWLPASIWNVSVRCGFLSNPLLCSAHIHRKVCTVTWGLRGVPGDARGLDQHLIASTKNDSFWDILNGYWLAILVDVLVPSKIQNNGVIMGYLYVVSNQWVTLWSFFRPIEFDDFRPQTWCFSSG